MTAHDLESWQLRFEKELAQAHGEQEHVDAAHDISHLRRVWQHCRQINEADELGVEPLVLMAAAYFHDIVNLPKNSENRDQASQLAAERALEILKSINFPTDYLDEVGGKTTLDLFVRELGGPVTKATDLSLDTSRSGGLPDPEFLQYPSTVTVPQGEDSVQIEVSERMDRMAGFLALDFSEGGTGGASYFVNFRKYCHDDYTDTIEKGDIPWQKVYDTCLRYFYLIFPAMSRRIPLNDEATITATAGEILKRISDPYRPTSLYMPLTRALSPGKIALLRAYLEQVSEKPG